MPPLHRLPPNRYERASNIAALRAREVLDLSCSVVSQDGSTQIDLDAVEEGVDSAYLEDRESDDDSEQSAEEPEGIIVKIVAFAERSLEVVSGWKASLSLGWSLVLLDLTLGIPISLLLTRLNKTIISTVGYDEIMRCPSGIMFTRVLFITVNVLLVVHWGLQLNEEERWRREIRWWDGVVRFLEGEREIVESVLAEEAEEQLRREAEKHVTAEEMIPEISSTVMRREIQKSRSVDEPSLSKFGEISSLRPSSYTASEVNIKKAVVDPKMIRAVKPRGTVGRKAGMRMRSQVVDYVEDSEEDEEE